MRTGFIIARIVAIIMLIFAVGRLPYDYYTLLRFIVCGVTAYGVYCAVEIAGKNGWAWAFGAVAVLFNPIFPIYLKKDTWAPIDLGVALFLFISLFLFKDPRSEPLLGKFKSRKLGISPNKAEKIEVVCINCNRPLRIPKTIEEYIVICPHCEYKCTSSLYRNEIGY